MTLTNWAGNLAYRAAVLHRPQTLPQLSELVSTRPQLRVLGSRHSFNEIADGDELLSLDALPRQLELDNHAATVTCSASTTYGELAPLLAQNGLALANLASLPHISVAGAVATATHGSGDANGNLATSLAALELMRSDGELCTLRRGEPDFDGAAVHLGALGAVTRVTLDVQPAFQVRQRVFEDLAWDVLLENLDAIMASGYSVSVFCRWGESLDQVWVKSLVGDGEEQVRNELFGARAAVVERHPILGIDPVNCSPQLGIPGPWWDRLPHFRMGFTPSSGEELQSEFHVARDDAPAAIAALRTLSAQLRPLTLVTEFRSVAADRLWLSPQYERDTLGIHFTWRQDWPRVQVALAEVERLLEPFDARPHWGKLFEAPARRLAPLYPRWRDFAALVERYDPRATFTNAWLRDRVLGAGG